MKDKQGIKENSERTNELAAKLIAATQNLVDTFKSAANSEGYDVIEKECLEKTLLTIQNGECHAPNDLLIHLKLLFEQTKNI